MKKLIVPAKSYTYIEDLWIVSCIFNPGRYSSKVVNYEKFIRPIQNAGLNYLIVDCAIGDGPFNLEEDKHIIKVRATNALWQKERLLNIAISQLPNECTKVAWIDCDVVFENPNWAADTSSLLDTAVVVQLFTESIRLPQGVDYFAGNGLRNAGFIYNYITNSTALRHGHPGFAWAAQKSFLRKFGLYDACIVGSADHVMAHTFRGDWYAPCNKKVFGTNENHLKHFELWAQDVSRYVDGRFSFIEGAILHLWHGNELNRLYTDREIALQRLKFDPYTDIALNGDKCWVLNEERDDINNWLKDYFMSRQED